MLEIIDMRRTPLKISQFTRSQADRFAFFLGTGFGVGISPLAPGTLGSLVGLAIAFKTEVFPSHLQWVLWSLVFLLGVWASFKISEISQQADHPSIVVDEVSGMWLVAMSLDMNAMVTPWLGFLAFRIFDILKPFPIRALDAWSKNIIHQSPERKWVAGFGVMIDDILAALMAIMTVQFLIHYLGAQFG